MTIPVMLEAKTAERRLGQPYKVVKDGVTLAIETLRLDISLWKFLDDECPDEEVRFHGVKLAAGIRGQRKPMEDTVDGMTAVLKAARESKPGDDPAGIFREAGLDPIKVLARTDGGSTGIVVDGALRVMAAQEAGMIEVPAQLIASAYARHPLYGEPQPDMLFVYCNWAHGQRLTNGERSTALRIFAQRHKTAHDGDRNAPGWAAWAAPQCGVRAALIVDAVENVFQGRTAEQIAEAEAALREAVKLNGAVTPDVVNAIAEAQRVTRTAIQKQGHGLGLPFKSGKKGGGDAESAKPAAATPLNLFAAMIPKFDVKHNLTDLVKSLREAKVAEAFGKTLALLDDWAEHEASEYMMEQAKLLWDPLDGFWSGLIRFAGKARVYRDAHIAGRDKPTLAQMLADAERAVKARRAERTPRRSVRAKARR